VPFVCVCVLQISLFCHFSVEWIFTRLEEITVIATVALPFPLRITSEGNDSRTALQCARNRDRQNIRVAVHAVVGVVKMPKWRNSKAPSLWRAWVYPTFKQEVKWSMWGGKINLFTTEEVKWPWDLEYVLFSPLDWKLVHKTCVRVRSYRPMCPVVFFSLSSQISWQHHVRFFPSTSHLTLCL
jgi:hypothetical protein